MVYVEFLRVRRALVIFAIIGIALAVCSGLILAFSQVNGKPESTEGIPLAYFFGVAGFLTWIVASILGPSINANADNVTTAWTKPRPRVELAAQIIGVDLLGIAAAFLVAFVFYTLAPTVFAMLRFHVPFWFSFDPARDLGVLALMLGCAVMYYGLIQAVTAWNRAKGGIVSGVSWPVFIVIIGLASWSTAPPAAAAIFHALAYLDPFAYAQSLSTHSEGEVVKSMLGLSETARIVFPWVIGLAGCAIAAFGWKRLEV